MAANTCNIATHRVLHLPNDILFLIFDLLLLDELIVAAGVCSQWRAVGLAHSTFAQQPDLRSATIPALERFIAQLHASTDSVLYVVLKISDDTHIVDAALSAVAAHVHRIEMARFHVHAHKAQTLFAALRTKAPRLTRLCIEFADTVTHCPGGVELPCDLFSGVAPYLKTLFAENAFLPSRPVPAFRNVIDAHLGVDFNLGTSLQFAPRRITTSFPGLRTLDLYGSSVSALEPVELGMLPHNLSILEVSCGPDTIIPLRYISDGALASTRFLNAGWSTPEIVDRTLRHLDNNLHLMMKYDVVGSDQCIIDVCDSHANLDRRFVHGVLDGRNGGLPAFFADVSWHSRVKEITISHRFWAHPLIARHLPTFSNLKKLNLVMDLDSEVKKVFLLAAGKLDCPALTSIAIMAPRMRHTALKVTTEDIKMLLAYGLVNVPRHLMVEIVDGLELDGIFVDDWTSKPVERVSNIDRWF